MANETTKRRDRRWWREVWVADHYAQLKSAGLLVEFMKHNDVSCASLARKASYERRENGSGKTVSRQMIGHLKTGHVRTCEPDLAAAIERVLNVPDHLLFDVLPKSHAARQAVKNERAA